MNDRYMMPHNVIFKCAPAFGVMFCAFVEIPHTHFFIRIIFIRIARFGFQTLGFFKNRVEAWSKF